MPEFLVTSSPSYSYGDVKENREHPGTPGDDVFTVSPDSHGFPTVNDSSGGSDTFILNLDVDPYGRSAHPYQEGGGTPSINYFDPTNDKVILGKGIKLADIVLGNTVQSNPLVNTDFINTEIMVDPHGARSVLWGFGSPFSMSWKEGRTLVGGGVSTYQGIYGHPIAVSAYQRKESDPKGYQEFITDIRERLSKRDKALYEVDDIGGFQVIGTSQIQDFMKVVYDENGASLYDYAFGSPNAADDIDRIAPPAKYKPRYVDKIVNFNPSADAVEVDALGFGINSTPKLAFVSGKKQLTKFARTDHDFLYDHRKGALYFNQNGSQKGFGDGGIIAIFKGGPELTETNFSFP